MMHGQKNIKLFWPTIVHEAFRICSSCFIHICYVFCRRQHTQTPQLQLC